MVRISSAPPTLADLARTGTLSLRFLCVDWPAMSGCGESWTTPTLRFDPDTTLPRLEESMFCPFCRSDRVQIQPIKFQEGIPYTRYFHKL